MKTPQEVRELAEKATPGPWKYDGYDGFDADGEWVEVVSDEKDDLLVQLPNGYFNATDPYKETQMTDDAKFIAAVNPEWVKALIDDHARMREALEKIASDDTNDAEDSFVENNYGYDWGAYYNDKAREALAASPWREG